MRSFWGVIQKKRWEEVGCCKDEVLWQASDDKMRLEDAEKKRKYENFQMERWGGEKGKWDEIYGEKMKIYCLLILEPAFNLKHWWGSYLHGSHRRSIITKVNQTLARTEALPIAVGKSWRVGDELAQQAENGFLHFVLTCICHRIELPDQIWNFICVRFLGPNNHPLFLA